MKTIQYEVNKEFPNVYNAIGTNYGLIPINNVNGEAFNLQVNHGDWIIYDDNKVCAVSDKMYKEYLQDQSKIQLMFFELR